MIEPWHEVEDVVEPIDGKPKGKNILSMTQFSAEDIEMYIDEAYAAAGIIGDEDDPGVTLLPHRTLKVVMRQESTRTGGSMTTAMGKLGGDHDLISGMKSSAEAKGESIEDSWIAFAAQADVIATRTADDLGPHLAAFDIRQSFNEGNLSRLIPVINLGDGRNEHPTQALGDLYTIHRGYGQLRGLKLAIVGDHERYRSHHSLVIGALTVGMEVMAVECDVAPVPDYIIERANGNLTRMTDLDAAMQEADILYIGRRPNEYEPKPEAGEEINEFEARRSQLLGDAYARWRVNYDRLQQMPFDSIVLHPRPRRDELDPDADKDPRTWDVKQMENMIPMRMAVLAGVFGKSIESQL